MRQYLPLEIIENGQKTGKWHYTCKYFNLEPFPVGYCGKDCSGHATAKDAAAHYREYLMDNAFFKVDDNLKRKCQVCGEWTQNYVSFIVDWTHILCDAHANKEGLNKVVPEIHSIHAS